MGGGSIPGVESIRRVDLGYFVRPSEETGTGPRVEPCLGYVVPHAESGFLLFDTGMGSEPDVDRHYRPARRPLVETLRRSGVTMDEVRVVVNSHLHFDHCGGNPELGGRPLFVQATELDFAQVTPDYTLPELIDFPGAKYERLDGEMEIAPGLLVVPTPGHTRDINPWSSAARTERSCSRVSPRTRAPRSQQTNSLGGPATKAQTNHCRPSLPGWSGSSNWIRRGCCSPTIKRYGNQPKTSDP